MYPKALIQLIEEFKKLPGVGNKTAERYAMKVLDWDHEKVETFARQLIETKEKVKYCHHCGNYTQDDLCDICQDNTRDHKTIMVVTTPKDILAIERLNQYHGIYHVLGGLISPMNHVMPEDLAIESLLAKVNQNVKEVILALSSTMEGETTALYLAKKIGNQAIVSHLAQGLPMGGQLEYIDDLTLLKSLDNRKKLEV